jgi:type IV secretory pathway VirD2 relaxase
MPLARGFIGFTPSLLQQSIVIVRWVPNRGESRWRAHGRYLAREGAQPEGQPGRGFNASEEEIDIADRLGGWERAGEPGLWKLIVSPEAGERLDLRKHARELLTTVEEDLGIRFGWVGIAHFDTAHPHLHVAIRGRSEEGVEFRMPREYVRQGLRLRSQELATQTLGFRFGSDVVSARERTVEAPRFGDLDQVLARRLDGDRRIEFESGVPVPEDARRERLLLLRRLGFLSSMGLARRVGRRRFELSEHHRATLERMQLTHKLRRSLMRYGELLVDPHAPLFVSELLPGVELRGRVVGETEDEVGGRNLLVLEGSDGSIHLVPQTPEIEGRRDRDEVMRGEIVTLRAIDAPPGSERMVLVEVTRHGRLSELEAVLEPSTLLDLEAVRSVREHEGSPPIDGPPSSFKRELREAIARRIPHLEARGVLKVLEAGSGEHVHRLAVTPDAEERIERAMRERDRGLTPLSEVERIHGKPVVHAKLEPGRVYQGRVVAMASDLGTTHIMLHTDSTLTAVPAAAGTLQVGREIRARAVAREAPGAPRWILTWQLDDLERERTHDRGRER